MKPQTKLPPLFEPSPARRGTALYALVGGLALIPLVSCTAWVWLQWAAIETHNAWLADTVRFSLFGGGALALIVGVYETLAIVWRRFGDHRYIEAWHVTSAIKAKTQVAPLAQSFSYQHSPQTTHAPPALALPEPEQRAPTSVPTFSVMLDQGLLGSGQPLILAYADDGPIAATRADEMASILIGGLPGTGKTTAQRFFAAQLALRGAKFACIDPHAGAEEDSLAATLEPFRSMFIAEPASKPKEMLAVVQQIADIGKARIEGRDKNTFPIALFADELTALLGRSDVGDDLATLIESIAQEFRKRFISVIGSGQIWSASRTTSELRDSFPIVLAFRMKRTQARMLIPSDEAQLVERLSPGRALLWRTSGDTQLVSIPNTMSADCTRTASMVFTPQITVTSSTSPTTPLPVPPLAAPRAAPITQRLEQPGTPQGSAGTGSGTGTAGTALSIESCSTALGSDGTTLVLSQFAGGKSISEIARELNGNKTGRGYQDKLDLVNGIIRASLKGA